MTRPETRRRRRDRTEPIVAIPPRNPAADQGATLNLKDPVSFMQWLGSNAEGFQRNADHLREQARGHWTAAAEHERKAHAIDAQLAEIANRVAELQKERDAEWQQKEMRAAEAKQHDDRAQNSEHAAADIQASLPLLKQAIDNAEISGPPAETRMEESLARIEAARAELPPEQREEDNPL